MLVQVTCISCKFSINKTEAISANCDFIVFTAELLQYSTESHEIKLLWKTRQKKPQNCCMAATASSLPRAVQRPLANYSSISWFLVAFCKAKITWFAVNTKHSTNCWENTRPALPQARVLSQDTPAWLGSWQKMGDSSTLDATQCPFLVSVLSTILGLILITKETLAPTCNCGRFC